MGVLALLFLGVVMRKLARFLFSRYFISAIVILAEFVLLFYLMTFAYGYSLFAISALVILDVAGVLSLITRNANPEFKVSWLIVMAIPLFGTLLYFIFYSRKVSKKEARLMKKISENIEGACASRGALQKARQRGKATTCINTFNGYGKAWMQYCDDNRGLNMPYWNATGSRDSTAAWGGEAIPDGTISSNRGMMAPYLGINNPIYLASWTNPWKSNPRVSKLTCPERQKTEIAPDTTLYTLWLIGLNSSHCWSKFSVNQIRHPGRHAVLMETLKQAQASATALGKGEIAFPHPGKTCTVIAAAGNVMSVPRSKMPTDHEQSFWTAKSKPSKNTW